jgi:hypothetical protein
MKIYIYDLKKLQGVMFFFESVPPEMDLFDTFLQKLKSKYEIINDINEADIAFIPIDYVKLIYGKIKDNQWHILHNQLTRFDKYSDLVPSGQPPTFGVGHKENYIKFFWYNFVKDYISVESKIPHFILYNYVLFETSFESIDKDIFILSYEDKVSFFNTTETFEIGTNNRVIPIPYVLNENTSFSLPQMGEIVTSRKLHDVTFIGSLDSENRPLIRYVRNFLLSLKSNLRIGDMSNIKYELMNTKYLFVLRGDTPTRISFYQCLVYNIVPIIFEGELLIYQKMFTDDIDLSKSCLVLPNKNELSDLKYSKIVDKILDDELSNPNNYTDKIKNHKILFDQINYFSDECLPIDIPLTKILNRSK